MRHSWLRALIILAVLASAIHFGAGPVARAIGAECGSGVGPCRCGDTVVTSTKLTGADPVLKTICPCNGLVVLSGVTLEISGTIRGQSDVCEDPAVSIPAGIRIEPRPPELDATGVVVTTGRIIGFEIGVLADGVNQSRLANLQVLDSSFEGIFFTGNDNVIERSIVLRTANRSGVDVFGERNTVRLNQIKDSDVFGLTVGGTDNLVSRNVVQRTRDTGILISGDHATVKQNRSEFNGGNGFEISGTNHTVSRNVAIENDPDGLRDGFSVSATASEFDRNLAERNGGFGIRDGTSGEGTGGTANTYVDNVCNDNGLGDSSPPGLCS